MIVFESMKPKINYVTLQKRYGGQYVASYKGRVIAHSRRASPVVKKMLKDRRASHIEIQFVERSDATCIYELSPSRKENRSR